MSTQKYHFWRFHGNKSISAISPDEALHLEATIRLGKIYFRG